MNNLNGRWERFLSAPFCVFGVNYDVQTSDYDVRIDFFP